MFVFSSTLLTRVVRFKLQGAQLTKICYLPVLPLQYFWCGRFGYDLRTYKGGNPSTIYNG